MLTYIGEIAEAVPIISPHTISSEVGKIFERDHKLEGVVIGTDKDVKGLMTKVTFYQKIAAKFGYDLFMGRPIELIMDPAPLIVDYFTTIVEVSTLAMQRSQGNLYDYVIVQKNNEFFGAVSIKDLLQTFAEVQTYMARYSNPLSGLPGNLLIENNLTKALDARQYSIYYFDLNHFKTYNDTYGFKKGDQVIRTTAQILQNHFHSAGDFLGHIGGDDFIGIQYHYDYQKTCEGIIGEFNKATKSFYTEEDYQKGYVYAADRNQNYSQIPLISLAIAVMTNKHHSFDNTDELSHKAAQTKAYCKRKRGSHFIADLQTSCC